MLSSKSSWKLVIYRIYKLFKAVCCQSLLVQISSRLAQVPSLLPDPVPLLTHLPSLVGMAVGVPAATPHAVTLMKQTVGSSARVKAAGGVRSRADAEQMIRCGADRIGQTHSLSLFTVSSYLYVSH